MDLSKNVTFVRFCFASASMLEENLGLTTEQLICLYKECIEMAKHCYDIDTMVASCEQFVSHSNSTDKDADSLRCPKPEIFINIFLDEDEQDFLEVTFVRFCFASASRLEENLGLSTEQLICLYKECIEMAKHCNDTDAMMASCVQFVSHSKRIGRHADSLRCLKEILPLAALPPSREFHRFLALTYNELKEFDNVVLHAKKWIEIARDIGDKESEMCGHYILGTAFQSLGRYDDTIDCGKKGLEIAKETDSAQGEMAAYNVILQAYKYMHKHDDAIVLIHKFLDCAMKTNDQKAMMHAYLQLGLEHLALKHYQEATDFGKKCIETAKQTEDKYFIEVRAYLLMGEIYKDLSDNDNSIIHCNKCIELAITIGDKVAEASAYSVLGEIYYSMGKYDDAIYNCNKCIHIDKEDDEGRTADVSAYFTLGEVSKSLEKYDEAIQNFKQCIDIRNRIGCQKEVKIITAACFNLAEIYKTSKQYSDAVHYYKQSIYIGKLSGHEDGDVVLACFYLGNIYDTLKQYSDAVHYYKQSIDIGNSTDCEQEAVVRACFYLGRIYDTLKQYSDAEHYYKQCIDIGNRIGHDKELVLLACFYLGKIYHTLKQRSDAITNYKQCIDIGNSISCEKEAVVLACLSLGEIYRTLEQHNDALQYYEQCIDIENRIDDEFENLKECVVRACLYVGERYKTLEQYSDAVHYFKQCIDIGNRIGRKKEDVVRSCFYLGEIYQTLEQYSDAVHYYKQSIDIGNSISCEKEAVVLACFHLGETYQTLEQHSDAVHYYKQCIDIGNRTGRETVTVVKACLSLGILYKILDQYSDAIHYSKKGIEIANRSGSEEVLVILASSASLHLGGLYQTLEQYSDAVHYYKQCIDIGNRNGRENTDVAKACLHLGKIYKTQKQYTDAIHYGKKFMDMAKETGGKEDEMKGHRLLAEVYIDSNQLNDASLSIDAGMAIAKELGDKEAEDKFEEIRFGFYVDFGMFDKANACNIPPWLKEVTDVSTCSEDDLVEDHAQAVKTGDITKIETTLYRLIIFYFHREDFKKAIICLGQLKEMNIDHSLFFFTQIGHFYQLSGQYDMALRCLEEGLPTAESSPDTMQRCEFFYRIGMLLFLMDRELDLAERYLREAIRCFEAIFTTLGSRDEFKISIFDKYIIHCYKILALLLIKGKRFEEALLVSDRCRARALKDLMISNFKMEQEESTDDHLEYSDVLSLVSRNEFSIAYYSNFSIVLMKFLLLAEIKNENPLFSCHWDYSLEKDVDKLFDEIGVGRMVRCEDRSLDKEQDVQKEQKRSEEEYEGLNQQTASLLNLDSKRGESLNEKSHAETKGSTLEVLFHILECEILPSKQDEVVIIPDGPLYKVPFPALRDPRTGKYLSETKRIRLVPSLATLKMLQARTEDYYTKKGALIVGNPLVGKVMYDGEETEFSPLENAFAEVLAVGNVFKEKPLTGEKATKEAVTQRLKQGVAVVHIAAHGSLTKGTIALAPSREIRATKIPDEEDYMLTMADVQQTQVRAQLVVLSCCHSGRGEIRAQGVVGLCRAFLASGARAVVASLWAIDDEATCDFMFKFYTRLMDGKSASASLQQAMAEMRNDSDYSKPKYWAPFFLMGDDVTFKL